MTLSQKISIFGLLWLSAVAVHGQVVESPTPVARGEWLFEADVAAAAWDSSRANGARLDAEEWLVGTFLFSTGVAERWDIQFGFDGWVQAEVTEDDVRERASGWGDAYLRAKWNFAGDESEGPAWAVLPYVKVPVADDDIGNGEWEGGVALLYGQPLGERSWMQAFVSGDTLRSDFGGRDELLVAGGVWGYQWTEKTTIYAEVLAEWLSAEDSDLPVTLGVGVSPEVASGFFLDFELLAGLTPEAPDWAAAVRIVWEL